MMLWGLADGGLGGNHDLPIELARAPFFERKCDDIGDAGIVHELLMKVGYLLISNEAETDTASMILIVENELNQSDELIVIEIDHLLEILDLHLDL